AVVVQPDGKTVIVGACGGPAFLNPSEICVARYTNAGAFDLSFGDFGIFQMTVPVGVASMRAVTLDRGRIIVAGSCGAELAQDFCVLRLNANGTPDTTFNATGLVITPVGTLDDQAHAVAMDGDRILVAGECEVAGSTNTCLVRYTDAGTRDGTFGNDGKAILALSPAQDGAYALALIEGQAYAGGRCGATAFCVIRLTAAGALDATWANGGRLQYDIGVSAARVTALAASGSRLLAAGVCTTGANADFCLLRIDSTGQPDTTLNGTGLLVIPMGTGEDLLTGLTLVGSATFLSGSCDSGARKVFCLVSITEAGGINGAFNGGAVLLDDFGGTYAVAAGLSPYFSTLTLAGTCGTPFTFRDWCFTRYSLFGQRDASLNTTGLVVTDLRASPGFDDATVLVRQGDGKYLAAGTCSDDGATYSRCLVRYKVDGTLDASFGTGGAVSVGTGSPSGDTAIALDADGRIYAAGGCVNGALFCVMRFLPTGALDTAYGTNGIASTGAGTGVTLYGIRGIVVDAAGNAVAGGYCNVPPGLNDFCAVRFKETGELDAGFGTDGKAFASFGPTDNAASFIADGTGFLISGDCRSDASNDYCVARLTSAGLPDPAFGSGTGKVIFPIGTGAFRPVAALSATGRIWLAGSCVVGGVYQFCIARLMPDGSLDTTFSGDGMSAAAVNGVSDVAYSLLPDGTGLLVAGGCQRSASSNVADFCMARFLADGTLDPAFNDTGVFTAHFGPDINVSYGRGLLRDGNRVVALVNGNGFTLAGLALLANDVPRAPTGVVATSGDGQLGVAFTAPTDNGGNPILSFTATCGDQSASGPASPIVVPGLVNGVTVTCTVTATNVAGTGPPSVASASVAPRKVTSVSVASSSNPSTSGMTITFTATITGQSPGGLVVFKDGGVTMASGCGGASVIAGQASCFISSLSTGPHDITGEYSGDAANAPSTSPVFFQTVIAAGFTLRAGPAGDGSGLIRNGRVTSSPAGIDCGPTTSNCQASFASGQQVTLTATPEAGYQFAFWTGACTGTVGCVVTMDAEKTVGAVFTATAPVPRALTIARSGSGTGTVTSTPAGIACGATCTANFDDGTGVVLAASPTAGSTFAGWTGSVCSGTGACNVTMDAAKNVTATFSLLPASTFALAVTKSGAGTGTVTSNPAGINCGAACTANFNSGASVALTAAPSPGSVFAGWSGGGCSGTGTCNVTMSSAQSVTATFSIQTFALTVTKTGAGTGTVTSTPAGIACGATCNGNFNSGVSVALAAAPATGSFFAGWSGACTGTGACNVTMDAAKSVGAQFKLNTAIPRLANISTRMQVLTGNDVLIGGFIIGGSAPKTVVVRARGPSLIPFGIANALPNPTMQLFSGQTVLATSDDWGTAANAAAITTSGFAPSSPLESAILTTLGPGAYTAVVSGVGGLTGVGIIEVFEVDKPEIPLLNISTRGQVLRATT
ncbi:MAG: Ig-like domain repeat protein, partial [Betaproteobacteria bacterium]|nr:Ig-like domain repeat protein [Betaproteobacteria bacterium]